MVDEILWLYWGKADPKVGGHHAMVLHSLDVAACAFALLRADPVLCRKLARRLEIDEAKLPITIALFAALHDLGKLDARFQIKAPQVAEQLQPGLLSGVDRGSYAHGGEGYRTLRMDSLSAAAGPPGGGPRRVWATPRGQRWRAGRAGRSLHVGQVIGMPGIGDRHGPERVIGMRRDR